MRGAPSVIGHTEDLALGGCALVADTEVPAGTAVRFVLSRPAESPITGSGTVLRSGPFSLAGSSTSEAVYRLAVQFVTLPAAGRRHLRDLLEPAS
jgi:hypothetical protein